MIIESPSTFGGIHVAEALEISYMRAFTMPWTKTSVYPQAFSVPSVDLGPGYNTLSYEVYEHIIWMASEGQINRWRRNMLGLKSTTLASLNIDQIPFMVSKYTIRTDTELLSTLCPLLTVQLLTGCRTTTK